MLSADRGESADRIAHPEYYERPALNLSASEPPQNISLANSAIYTSHRLSTWGQRTWKVCQWDVTSTACIPFLLAGFLQRALPVRTFLATKHCFCNMYILQICAVAFSALSAVVGYHVPQAFWAATICTIGIGSISSVRGQGSALSVEKEWSRLFV